MNNPPSDVFVRLVGYALPLRTASELSPSDVRRSLSWGANLRRVNRHWRALLDGDDSFMWFHVAQALGLGPPLQLYEGGNYLGVCKALLAAEHKKSEAQRKVKHMNENRGWVACGIGMHSSPKPLQEHPHPERPVVELSTELMERVAANAKALETFLSSVDFQVLNNREGELEQWCESALIRYRMFLYLKRAHPNKWLVPTVEIEFCWLAHIFRTENYWKDVTALGIDPSHSLCMTSYGEVATYTKAVEGTSALWNAEFGANYPFIPEDADTSWEIWTAVENFFADAEVHRSDPRRFFPRMGPAILTAPSKITLPSISLTAEEVRADLSWFPELRKAFGMMGFFAYNVTRGGDQSALISKQILPSYERFINLCNQEKVKDPAPPIILDLVWHAHQMEPVRYREECLSLFGREFWHHPWPKGLGVMSKPSDDFECAWKTAYGTPIADDWKFYINPRERALLKLLPPLPPTTPMEEEEEPASAPDAPDQAAVVVPPVPAPAAMGILGATAGTAMTGKKRTKSKVAAKPRARPKPKAKAKSIAKPTGANK